MLPKESMTTTEPKYLIDRNDKTGRFDVRLNDVMVYSSISKNECLRFANNCEHRDKSSVPVYPGDTLEDVVNRMQPKILMTCGQGVEAPNEDPQLESEIKITPTLGCAVKGEDGEYYLIMQKESLLSSERLV